MRYYFKALLSSIIVSILIISDLSGCSIINVNYKKVDQMQKGSLYSEETQTLAMPNVEKLRIKNETGQIKVERYDGDVIKILSQRTVTETEAEAAKIVFENIAISAKTVDKSFNINVVTKDGDDDFWAWKNAKYNDVNTDLNIYVEIPKDFKIYEIELLTGDIEMKNLNGIFQIQNVTGNIALDGAEIQKESRINLITGNINIDANLANLEKLEIDNITGNVDLNIPKKSSVSLEANVKTGSISGSFINQSILEIKDFKNNLNDDFNGGGKKVKITTITGNIKVNSK